MNKVSNYNVIDLVEDADGFLNITPREAFEKWNKAIFVLRNSYIADDNTLNASIDIVTSVHPGDGGYELSTVGLSVYISEGIDSKFHID